MSIPNNGTNDQTSCQHPTTEVLGLVSTDEPFFTSGESMEEEVPSTPMDSEVAEITSSVPLMDKTVKNPSTRPITPNPDIVIPSHLKDSFEAFKQKYPSSSFFVSRDPPVFQRGRAFSISEVEIRDDWAEQKYRETFPGKFPVPSGIWEELAHLDAQIEIHYNSLESFLPNEEWVAR